MSTEVEEKLHKKWINRGFSGCEPPKKSEHIPDKHFAEMEKGFIEGQSKRK